MPDTHSYTYENTRWLTTRLEEDGRILWVGHCRTFPGWTDHDIYLEPTTLVVGNSQRSVHDQIVDAVDRIMERT